MSSTSLSDKIAAVTATGPTLKRIQSELEVWQKHNFPNREAWQPILGLQEELGELSHAFLKRHEGIRAGEQWEADIRDAVADILIFLLDVCNAEGIDLDEQVSRTWSHVQTRDWKADPIGGKPEVEP